MHSIGSLEQDHRRIKRLTRPRVRLWQLPNRTTNTGWLRDDGDDQKGTGSKDRWPRHASPGCLRHRTIPSCDVSRADPVCPTMPASHSKLCNRTTTWCWMASSTVPTREAADRRRCRRCGAPAAGRHRGTDLPRHRAAHPSPHAGGPAGGAGAGRRDEQRPGSQQGADPRL
jgi:hypothetical protein